MKRILINATHNEEIRVALCKDSHLYDFDLENRTREQKKANIYKGHITRVEPSLEAVFVEYGSVRQGFLPLREIAPEYLNSNVRSDNIRELIKEGDEVIIQIEKEERGNKGAAVSTYLSLAGRYLVLMPNNSKGGGISRQISGKVREEMKQIIASLSIPKGMSVIVRTAGIGKGFEDLQNDLNHLLDIWSSIQEQNRTRPSPCLVHQEAGVVTRAVRDYLRDDIGEVWIDSEHAYNEAAHFIASVMPNQMSKLRKYTDYEPLFSRFGIERQIETAYQREVRLPSGGSIVIDQTEAMVAIDINSAKSTKGSDVAETAYHTNLEAADEIARQLRLRDMGGLIVIDFIDMNDPRHQKDVEKRLIDATRYDRARVQFAEISKFGLMEMSRQRLRPSLDEATGYICPRCHGNGMIRDLRSLALSIMRQIEQIALKERMGEIQAEVPTEIAAFLLNEKRESLVYLEQDSGVRITVLPHAHLESPNFSLHFNPDGFAPSSYERIVDVEERESGDLGYDTNWHTKVDETTGENRWQKAQSNKQKQTDKPQTKDTPKSDVKPQAVAWLSNLFAPKPQAKLAHSLNTSDVAAAIESIVNDGAVSLGAAGQLAERPSDDEKKPRPKKVFVKKEPEKAETKTDKTEPKSEKRPKKDNDYPRRETGSHRPPRSEMVRGETLKADNKNEKPIKKEHSVHLDSQKISDKADEKAPVQRKEKPARKTANPKDVVIHIGHHTQSVPPKETIHLSLDNSKGTPSKADDTAKVATNETATHAKTTDNTATSQQVHNPEPADISNPPSVHVNKTADTPTVSSADDTTAADKAQNQNGENLNKTIASEPSDTANQDKSTHPTRAINDPRVVMVSQKRPAITGSAEAFIVSMLGEYQGDFVASFLKAMNLWQQPVFDFTNYGYEPLAADYLLTFTSSITPSGQYQTPQGKTHVAPPVALMRAKNDPRGQLVTPTPQETADDTNETLPDTHVGDDVNDDTHPLITDANTNALGDNTAKEPVVDTTTETADVSDDTGDKPDDKKRLNSYKDMIESVSGQLLPQVGILNLVAAKKKVTKPKTPKNPVKKTSKAAQKAEVVKRVKTDETPSDNPPDDAQS
ncbi:Rne/Rng family ribonuclease [Moraxella sp. VT-16-12]|uniref:Rne/Rng family ribonuclease n=1 Tax=Moraxella sp. VT-16-12 TaxID=2014877 RepID=UPI000B7E8C15|nr:Rne/Rng family ribonuclease [Moraxella sp. VT-16-12]TWV83024.1 Rne/Rng family ribonuclease [Moraxella sp. VT-16-12]